MDISNKTFLVIIYNYIGGKLSKICTKIVACTLNELEPYLMIIKVYFSLQGTLPSQFNKGVHQFAGYLTITI
jgi:hypothetical protein